MHLPQADAELVQILIEKADAAFADAARRAGPWLMCRPGCSQCCHGAFALNALDAARLREGMEQLRVENPPLAATVEKRARGWISEHGSDFPGSLQTGILGDSEQERDRFEEFANEAACPALDPATGCCDLYAARPMTCRVFGPPVRMQQEEESGLGCCELCFVGASEEQIAACEMKVPQDLEARILSAMNLPGETVVAFALVGLGPGVER
jgi:Fe-S-cluster containining protein